MFGNKFRAGQLLRFCTVGLGNMTIDFTAFFLLLLGGVPYLLAQIISYAAGVVNSFVCNRQWTFGVRVKVNFAEAAKFAAVNVTSLLISAGLLFVLHNLAGANQNLWLSKLAATGGGMAINFLGSRFWVFSEN